LIILDQAKNAINTTQNHHNICIKPPGFDVLKTLSNATFIADSCIDWQQQ